MTAVRRGGGGRGLADAVRGSAHEAACRCTSVSESVTHRPPAASALQPCWWPCPPGAASRPQRQPGVVPYSRCRTRPWYKPQCIATKLVSEPNEGNRQIQMSNGRVMSCSQNHRSTRVAQPEWEGVSTRTHRGLAHLDHGHHHHEQQRHHHHILRTHRGLAHLDHGHHHHEHQRHHHHHHGVGRGADTDTPWVSPP